MIIMIDIFTIIFTHNKLMFYYLIKVINRLVVEGKLFINDLKTINYKVVWKYPPFIET